MTFCPSNGQRLWTACSFQVIILVMDIFNLIVQLKNPILKCMCSLFNEISSQTTETLGPLLTSKNVLQQQPDEIKKTCATVLVFFGFHLIFIEYISRYFLTVSAMHFVELRTQIHVAPCLCDVECKLLKIKEISTGGVFPRQYDTKICKAIYLANQNEGHR